MHKVILIEDDPTMLSLLQTLLQMEGFDVVSVNPDQLSGFIDIVRTERPHLALIDVHLRQGSGYDLVRLLRQDPELKDIYVVLSSGMDVSSKALEAGADDFIMKPYMPDDLIHLIRRTMTS
jgi:DNA-binding response OmpR family regulator